MKMLVILLLALAGSGCTSVPRSAPPVDLLVDAAFQAPATPIDADAVFALSDAMERYVRHDIAGDLRRMGPREGLISALYTRDKLRLEYDATMTRNAAEAFDARSGNCLSLVIMTAAFAKRLGLPLTYQVVSTDELWTRSADLYLANGHINVTLARRPTEQQVLHDAFGRLTIDFLPQGEIERQKARRVDESTVLAMYMNNRAAETLAQGRLDEAYAWAREAVLRDPDFMSGYNTLGVIYRRHGLPERAEAVFRRVLEHDHNNAAVLANLTRLLQSQAGREAEVAELARRLARIETTPPFHDYQLGREAMTRGDHAEARRHFARQVERTPLDPEFHFWLAQAEFALGDVGAARQQLGEALRHSATRRDQDLYAAKLDVLRGLRSP